MTKNKLDCLNCGVCCFIPYLSGTKFKGIEIGKDGWCVHYDKEEKCTIYSKRPMICRKYVSGSPNCIELRKCYLNKIEKE